MIIINSALGQSWTVWNEITESGWGDSANTYIALMEGGLGANETGQGAGLSGADLVLTQNGNIAASAGGMRALDGTDDYFAFTAGLSDIIIARNTWTIIVKVGAMTAVNNDRLFQMTDVGGNNNIIVSTDAVGCLIFYVSAGGVVALNNAQTTDAAPAASDFWFWLAGDGTNTYGGWSTTMPSSHTAIAAAQRVQAATFTQFATFDTGRAFGAASNGAIPSQFSPYYMIISKSNLITY